MMKTCPSCERPTYWARCGGHSAKPKDLPKGIVTATVSDGTCMTCWRHAKGVTRLSSNDTTIKREVVYRYVMTDEDIQKLRGQLTALWASRRRRGVPPDGHSLRTIQRSGLSLMEA